MTDSGLELLIAIRRTAGAPPLGDQVEAAIRSAIRDGRMHRGQRLPPSRTLALDLGVSRRVIVEAFEQLTAEGWLDTRVGAGTYVRATRPLSPSGQLRTPTGAAGSSRGDGIGAAPARRVRPPRFDFFPGHPDLSAFPRAAWGRATRDALREVPDAALGYGDPRGYRELRVAIATMLGRSRGVVCRPRQVVICQGAVQALNLLVQATATRLGSASVRAAVEDPYLPEHREVLTRAGAEVIPVPVDELGVHDEAIAAARCHLALITPAHQCPTGALLSAGRRAALVAWAQHEDALLIEDDYDAEYRYDRPALAALQALAPDHVAYLGSASKTLAPGIRLAWLVVPEARLADVVAAKRYADAGSPVLEQATLAKLIDSGAYDRHVRGARRRQRQRRDAVIAAVTAQLPGASVAGISAGLHVLVRLPRPVDAAALLAAADAREVRVYPLSLWRADPPSETSAIVLGYGALHPAAISEGVKRLAEAVREITPRPDPPLQPLS